jgi:glucan phosphorylase
VQIVFSGKAHPADEFGKDLIRKIVQLSGRPELRTRIVFIEDYDIYTARSLIQGIDIWLSTPRRPLEASGTSGMKAAMNGALNVSILDGWWPEGCRHGVNGWAIGDETAGDDLRDLESLYRVLEQEVLPAWADRPRWIRMMRESIAMATQQFSSDRMVGEYFELLYSEAAPQALPAPESAQAPTATPGSDGPPSAARPSAAPDTPAPAADPAAAPNPQAPLVLDVSSVRPMDGPPSAAAETERRETDLRRAS